MDAMDRFVSRENIKRYRQSCRRIDGRCRAITNYEIAGRRRSQVQVGTERQTATLPKNDHPSTRQPRIGSRMTERSSELVASRKAADPHANRLLGLLPPRDYARLRPHLHRIALEYRQSLYRAHKPIGFVYFIETGVGSLVNTGQRPGNAEFAGNRYKRIRRHIYPPDTGTGAGNRGVCTGRLPGRIHRELFGKRRIAGSEKFRVTGLYHQSNGRNHHSCVCKGRQSAKRNLSVEIWKDGRELASNATSAPFGTASVSANV